MHTLSEEKAKRSAKDASAPKQADSTSAALAAQSETSESASEKSALDKVTEALSSSNGKAVVNALMAASQAELKEIAGKPDTVRQIMALEKAYRNPSLDSLYSYVTEVGLMIEMVDARFGVPLGSANVKNPDDVKSVEHVKGLIEKNKDNPQTEVAWTLNGAMHVYSTYLLLPQGHLDMIKAVLTLDTRQSGVSGAAYWGYGVYYVNYNDKSPNAKENGGHTEPFAGLRYGHKDTRNGLVMLDMTIAHELGHCVDARLGMLSDKADFLEISGWEKHDKSSPEKLYDAIVASFEEPYPSDFNATEKDIARKAGSKILSERAVKKTDRDEILAQVVEDEYKEPENASSRGFFDKLFNKNSGGRTSASLLNALKKVKVIKHITRGFADNSPWYSGELFSGMKRQIHEAYDTDSCWFSYKNEAWKRGKISRYQFRAPCEEFAELYASYHVANPKGSHTPDLLKTWFLSKGLDKMESTEGANTKSASPEGSGGSGRGGKF